MQIFDWIKELTVNKSNWESFTEEEQATFNPYMVHRFLSMNPDYIEFVNLVQTFSYSDKEKIYKIYLYMLPKKSMFFKYIKSTKSKPKEALLKHIASYYDCSLGEAEEYTHILREVGVVAILTKLGVDEKEQKKLLKNG